MTAPAAVLGILAVQAAHALTRPRAASGALASLDSAALAALLQAYYVNVVEPIDLSDTQEGLPAEVVSAAPLGRASSLLEGFRNLVGRSGAASVSLPLGPLDEEDEDEDGEIDEDDVERGAYLPPGVLPGTAAASSRARPRKSAHTAEAVDLQALVAAGAPVNEVIQLKMLEMLTMSDARQRGGARAGGPEGSSGSGSDVNTSTGGRLMTRGVRSIQAVQRIRRRIRDQPGKVVRNFERAAREELGVPMGGAWALEDWVKRQSWGRMRGLQRCAIADCAVVQALHRNEPARAQAQAVQDLKARLQAALNQGDWSQAWLLTGLPDPLSARHFAGDESEMAAIAGYTTAMVDLRAKTRLRSSVSPPPPTAEGQGEAEDTRTAQDGRGRGRGRRGRGDASGAGRGGAAPPTTS